MRLTLGGLQSASKVKKRVARQSRVKTRGLSARDRQSIPTDSKRSTRSRLAVVLNKWDENVQCSSKSIRGGEWNGRRRQCEP